MKTAQSDYHSYLLRMWRVKDEAGGSWRASLEEVQSGELHGFADLAALLRYLEALALAAEDPAESAEIIQRIFAGEPGPCRDTVLAGAAAALRLVGAVASLREGVQVAADAIDRGAADEKLEALCGDG